MSQSNEIKKLKRVTAKLVRDTAKTLKELEKLFPTAEYVTPSTKENPQLKLGASTTLNSRRAS